MKCPICQTPMEYLVGHKDECGETESYFCPKCDAVRIHVQLVDPGESPTWFISPPNKGQTTHSIDDPTDDAIRRAAAAKGNLVGHDDESYEQIFEQTTEHAFSIVAQAVRALINEMALSVINKIKVFIEQHPGSLTFIKACAALVGYFECARCGEWFWNDEMVEVMPAEWLHESMICYGCDFWGMGKPIHEYWFSMKSMGHDESEKSKWLQFSWDYMQWEKQTDPPAWRYMDQIDEFLSNPPVGW